MSKPPLPESTQLLDDLESIRALLGDETLEPPLLTDTVYAAPVPVPEPEDEQIPMLFEAVGPAAAAPMRFEAEPAAAPAAATPERNRQDLLLHLDADLRSAAQQIMQDVIDDFAPHIETEIRRRLEARMERLLNP